MAASKLKVRRPVKKARRTGAITAAEDLKTHGTEPEWDTQSGELTQSELIEALNWYNYIYSPKECYDLLLEETKGDKEFHRAVKRLPYHKIPRSVGPLMRIVSRGAKLSNNDRASLDRYVNRIKKIAVTHKQEKKEARIEKVDVPTLTIRQRLDEKAGQIIADVEEHVDNCNYEFSLYDYLQAEDLGGVYGQKIADYYQPIVEDIEEILKSKDKELIQSLTVSDIKAHLKWLKNLVDDGNRFANNQKRQRKPRKKKANTEKMLSKVKYCAEYNPLKIVSINPSQVLDKQVVWLYNTSNNTLTRLVAEENNALTIKGTTIVNADLSASWTRRLGKANEKHINVVLRGNKTQRNRLNNQINSKDMDSSGRLNANIVILRAE